MNRVARVFLIVVSIFNSFAGLLCGLLLIAEPDGRLLQMGALLPVVQTFPLAGIFFRDFFWLGVAMLLALGLPNLVAAVMLFRNSNKQYVVTLFAGVVLVLWCSFEFIYMFNIAAVGYFVVGVLSILSSALLARPQAQARAEQAY
ncbi:MAG: hypothetical protein P4L93_06555 [Coriobacteriia bacterium]|nr:hypothetical protein [Coriobacteriia bacterium]